MGNALVVYVNHLVDGTKNVLYCTRDLMFISNGTSLNPGMFDNMT